MALSTNPTVVLTFRTQPFLHGNEVVLPTGYSSLCEFVDKGQTKDKPEDS